jgi:hypothetical protein
MMFPQPSGIGPGMQNPGAPGSGGPGGASTHVKGMHTGEAHELHWPAVPAAPHASFAGQLPQSSIVLHPSQSDPHA